MSKQNDEYFLTTNSQASARLNLQHFWNQLSCGYIVHPEIPINEYAKIADIGTGTGIWPISLSTQLPSTVQLDGYDITDAQYPPSEWLPQNVALKTWNIFDPVPEELVGKYDVVNIRYFAILVRKDNFASILQNLISLLKPNGYLQWVEVNMAEQQIVSTGGELPPAACAFSDNGKKAIASMGVNFDWLRDLAALFHEHGLVDTKQFAPKPVPALRQMSTHLALGGWEEFSYGVLDKKGPHPLLGNGQDLRDRILEVRKELQGGAAIEQVHYVTIGRLAA